ncbi:hypothetical protein BDV96DRAFT_588660 [Lophiotrema nucula]|uniref:Uncharacterized protein n=1 Tax=Lophiotrema nucula TaxID=690887 RepID=A0A6A5YM04_9PLEO|nr:hypothetical protein BDV96DRAFT_588660 [Lophiotrema nucula]
MAVNIQRTLLALPFVALSVVCFFLMDILALIRDFPPPSATMRITWDTGAIPILQRFHWIPLLDEIYRDVTVGFAPSTLGYDDVSRWHMYNFMSDIGVMYMIWLLESSRPMNKSWVIRYPVILFQIAQLVGGGVVIPLYYLCHTILAPPANSQNHPWQLIRTTEALCYAPAILIIHTFLMMLMYFSPSLEARHYWTWFWQLFPVRIALTHSAFYILSKWTGLQGRTSRVPYRTAMIMAIGPFIAISAGTYIYTALESPYPLYDVFLPTIPLDLESGKSWVLRMRNILQIDQVIISAATFLWVSYLVQDMRVGKLVSRAETWTFFAMIALVPIVGQSATYGLMWLRREFLMNRKTEVTRSCKTQ